MATEQVLNWIGGAVSLPNQPALKLSQNIDSFESDFANGYLFAEILAQYGLVSDVSTFSKKMNKEAKVNNFYQIEDVLRAVKVNFDAKLIHQVMQEERGASLKLLYQVKIALDRHFAEGQATVTGLQQARLDRHVKKVSELSMKLPKVHKEYGIDGSTIAPAPFLKSIEEKLLKFELAHVELRERAQKGEREEKRLLETMQQSKRQEAMRKMHENKEFMSEWEQAGKQNWKRNMRTRAAEIKRALEFEDREVRIYKQRLEREMVSNTNDLINGVEDFHENMKKQGIEENRTIAEAMKILEEKKGLPPGQIQNFSYAATMNKIKETKSTNEFAGKERERRNRKMKVDQQRIQEQLDGKKNEEDLITRLLEAQAAEQSLAMDRQRNFRCEALVTQNRKKLADQAERRKHDANAKIEREMRDAAAKTEGPRAKAHDQSKVAIAGKRREEKARKRRVNVEIASELIDMIVDVMECAGDQMEAGHAERVQAGDEDLENELISKATWRHWMSLFTDGKKVSEENIIVEDVKDKPRFVGSDSMTQLLTDADAQKVLSPFQLMTSIGRQQIYTELLQYLAQTGIFNLRMVVPDKWQSFSQIIAAARRNTSGLEADYKSGEAPPEAAGLLMVNVPTNEDLGAFINRMYEGPFGSKQSVRAASIVGTSAGSTVIAASSEHQGLVTGSAAYLGASASLAGPSGLLDALPAVALPLHHAVKLCLLGPMCSGKETAIRALKESLGESLTVFKINDVVREALTYVHPDNQKQEEADPKAKGKGKAADAAPVDVFAGKDTEAYKAVAEKVLKSVQLTTGAQEIPAGGKDLADLVSDEQVLVDLFCQKLKLTFEGTDAPDVDQVRRDKIAKEKELREQIEEAKAAEANEAADPKAKGKKGAARSAAELQDDLKQLLSLDKSGWVLVDFPRTLEQARAMEKAFTGYQAKSDMTKAPFTEQYEVWSKFTDPEQATPEGVTSGIVANPSAFDAVIMLDTPKEEAAKRATGRKIDPQTGKVYAAEEKLDDPKATDRLEDFYGGFDDAETMLSNLEVNHLRFRNNKASLTEYLSDFGLFDEDKAVGFETLKTFSEAGGTEDDLVKQISETVDCLLGFKQIEEDRLYAAVKETVAKEEAEAAEAAARAEEEAKSASKSQGKQSPRPDGEETKGDDAAREDAALAQEAVQIEQTPEKLERRASKLSETAQSRLPGTSRSRKKGTEYTRAYLVKLWEDMEMQYMRDGLLALSNIKFQRQSVTDNLNDCQRKFIDFLERPCERQDKINEFVESLNQFSMEYPDLRSDEQTKDELLSRLEKLSNSLWDITNSRKEEAIEHIATMSRTGWAFLEMKQLCKNMAALVEIEIKKFVATYQIIAKQEPPIELDAEIFTRKALERGVQPYDFDHGHSPVLQQMFMNLLTKANELLYKEPIPEASAQEQIKILKQEHTIFIYKLAFINSLALVTLDEIQGNANKVYQRLDDWIVTALEQESIQSQEISDMLRSSIQNEQLQIDEFSAQMSKLDVASRVEAMIFRNDEKPRYMEESIPITDEDVTAHRFSLEQLEALFKELKYNAGARGHRQFVETTTFTNIIFKAVKRGQVPLGWKYLDYGKIASIAKQFETTPFRAARSQPTALLQEGKTTATTWVDWKQALLSFALLKSPVPSPEEVTQMKEQLQADSLTKAAFQKMPLWFDRQEGRPDPQLKAQWIEELRIASVDDEYEDELDPESLEAEVACKLDNERLAAIKALVFDIYRAPTGADKLRPEGLIQAVHGLGTGLTFEDVAMGA